MPPLKTAAVAIGAALTLAGCVPKPTPERDAMIDSFVATMHASCDFSRSFSPGTAETELRTVLARVSTWSLVEHTRSNTRICFDSSVNEMGNFINGSYVSAYYPRSHVVSLGTTEAASFFPNELRADSIERATRAYARDGYDFSLSRAVRGPAAVYDVSAHHHAEALAQSPRLATPPVLSAGPA